MTLKWEFFEKQFSSYVYVNRVSSQGTATSAYNTRWMQLVYCVAFADGTYLINGITLYRVTITAICHQTRLEEKCIGIVSFVLYFILFEYQNIKRGSIY